MIERELPSVPAWNGTRRSTIPLRPQGKNLDAPVRMCEYGNMRATIDLPDALFRRAKAISSLQGTTLKEFITRAVEHELSGSMISLESRRVEFPLVRSKRPGSIRVTPDTIASLLEREESDVSP